MQFYILYWEFSLLHIPENQSPQQHGCEVHKFRRGDQCLLRWLNKLMDFGWRNEFSNHKLNTEEIVAVRAPCNDILIFSFIKRQIWTKLGIYASSQENTQISHFVIAISNTKARTSEVGK